MMAWFIWTCPIKPETCATKVPFATVPLKQAIKYAKNYFETHAEALEAQFKGWG